MATSINPGSIRKVLVVPLIRVIPALSLLSYNVPANLSLHPGEGVKIPFRTKIIKGIVWSVDRGEARKETKAVLGRMADASLTVEQLVLAQWLQHETLTPLNIILRRMILGKAETSLQSEPEKQKTTVVECASGLARRQVIAKWAQHLAANPDRTLILAPNQGAVSQWTSALAELHPLHIVPSRSLTAQQNFQKLLVTTRTYITTHVGLLYPLPRIQRVIVDLADDEAYFAFEQAPRLDLRILAAEFARIHGANLLVLTRWLSPAVLGAFGKAKPSILGTRPAVTVIDRQNEPASERGHIPPPNLLEKLQGTRTLWLHTRTSEAGRYVCFDCGTPVLCPKCKKVLRVSSNTPLTLECLQDHLKLEAPSSCGVCRGTSLTTRGPGIQQVARTLAEAVGANRVATLEYGTTQGDLQLARHVVATTAIGSHPTLTFTAAVLLQPDSYFSMSGYRSTEQFFSALALARAAVEPQGTLYIVTYKPETPAYAFLNRPDDWSQQTLTERQSLHYPPAGTLVVLQPRKRLIRQTEQPFPNKKIPNGVTKIPLGVRWLLRTGREKQEVLLNWIENELDPSWEAIVNPPSLPQD